jgi:hypothetical protein
MKRKSISIILLTGTLALTITSHKARGQLFNVGDKHLNFTVGYGTPWVLHNHYRTMLPPLAVSFDLGFRDDLGPGVLSIGGIVGATTYKYVIHNPGWIYEYGEKSTTLIGAIRGTYHYQLLDKLDTYGAIHVGLRYESWRNFGTTPSNYVRELNVNLYPIFNLIAGAKYFISDDIFVMAEFGYSIAFINVGLGLKL